MTDQLYTPEHVEQLVDRLETLARLPRRYHPLFHSRELRARARDLRARYGLTSVRDVPR